MSILGLDMVELHDARERLDTLGGLRVHLSITQENPGAAAVALVEGDRPDPRAGSTVQPLTEQPP
ncbi:MAG: hypothetical protein MPN21_11325 [Thermoanaerobaculia bacterium]|nr:hypothetical protein [Thermoanaerobaculia bacterium]